MRAARSQRRPVVCPSAPALGMHRDAPPACQPVRPRPPPVHAACGSARTIVHEWFTIGAWGVGTMTARVRTAGLLGIAAGAGLAAWARSRRRHGSAGNNAHTSETAAEYAHSRHRVLILGAGFGGLMTARVLADRL